MTDLSLTNKFSSSDPMSPALPGGKKDRKKSGGGRNFEQLMAAGSALTPLKHRDNAETQEEKKAEKSKPEPKEFLYNDPGVKIGTGKFGPVNLIIY